MARGRKAKGPLHIGGDSFNGRRDLSAQDCDALQASSVEEGVNKVVPGYNGGITALTTAIIVENRVSNFLFHTRGEMYAETAKTCKSGKFFNFSGHVLTIHSIDSKVFVFHQGLASDLVDCSKVDFSIKKDGSNAPVDPEDLIALGFEGFSVKLVVVPTSEIWAKFSLVLFPLGKSTLLQKFPLAGDQRFPGLLLDSGHCRLSPGQGDILPQADWGNPILPILLSSSRFSETSGFPASKDLRVGLATLLRRARRPVIKRDKDTLSTTWREIEAQGANALCAERMPDRLWPAPSSGWNIDQGRYLFFLCLKRGLFTHLALLLIVIGLLNLFC